MKPRTTLAEAVLPDGSRLALQQHDGRHALVIHGQQICGPSTRAVECELARLACAPFRPARQPRLWFAGLGLGHAVAAAAAELRQKRALFTVAEPLAELVAWHRLHLTESPLANDGRIVLENDCGPQALRTKAGTLHAIVLHLDAAPLSPAGRPWAEDRAWLAAAYDALQEGGLLAVGGSRPSPILDRCLRRAGFQVAQVAAAAAPGARRSRMHPVWLARKGKGAG